MTAACSAPFRHGSGCVFSTLPKLFCCLRQEAEPLWLSAADAGQLIRAGAASLRAALEFRPLQRERLSCLSGYGSIPPPQRGLFKGVGERRRSHQEDSLIQVRRSACERRRRTLAGRYRELGLRRARQGPPAPWRGSAGRAWAGPPTTTGSWARHGCSDSAAAPAAAAGWPPTGVTRPPASASARAPLRHHNNPHSHASQLR